jgi:Tfp pilus assembly protein PilF
VTGRLRQLLEAVRRRPRRALLGLFLIGSVLLGGYPATCYLRAEYQFRAAREELGHRNFAVARDHLARCLQLWPAGDERRFLAAQTARRAGAYGEADRLLADCARRRGKSRAVARERELLRADRGGLDGRLEASLWADVQEGDPDALLILEALTRAYLHAYRLEDALRTLERWLGLKPEEAQAFLLRGWVWQARLDVSRALADYRRALELDPEYFDARLYLAQLLAASGEGPTEAADHLECLRQRQPTNLTVLLVLAHCRRRQARTDEARHILDSLLADHSDSAAVLRERGALALDEGDAAAAEVWLRRSVEADPFDNESAYQLGQCLIRLGRKDAAQEYLDRAATIEADLGRLHRLIAEVSLNPGDPALRCEAGRICLRNGQTAEGLRWLDGALQLDPACRAAHQALAEHYDQAGQPDQADLHRRSVTP